MVCKLLWTYTDYRMSLPGQLSTSHSHYLNYILTYSYKPAGLLKTKQSNMKSWATSQVFWIGHLLQSRGAVDSKGKEHEERRLYYGQLIYWSILRTAKVAGVSGGSGRGQNGWWDLKGMMELARVTIYRLAEELWVQSQPELGAGEKWSDMDQLTGFEPEQ